VEEMKYASPRHIAKQLGYSSPDRALTRFPDLCLALKALRSKESKAKRTEIRRHLKSALSAWPVPTLAKVAGELKMSSSTQLRALEPGLCDRLLKRREQRSHDYLKSVELMLETATEAATMLPLKQFCSHQGIPVSLVIRRLPAQKKCYEESYRSSKTKQRLRKAEAFQDHVKIAVTRILEKGDFPSVSKVLLTSPDLRYAGWDKVTRAIQVVIRSDG
jgi:hypothetical protein